jgi:hypothetical protein
MDIQNSGSPSQAAPDSLRFTSGFWLFAAVVAQWFFAACLVAHHS